MVKIKQKACSLISGAEKPNKFWLTPKKDLGLPKGLNQRLRLG